MKYVISIALLLPIIAFGASSPESAATAYAEAVIRQDWRTAAGQFRASDLKRIRSAFARQMQRAGGEGVRKAFFPELSAEETTQLSDVEFCEKLFFGYFTSLRQRGVHFEIERVSVLGVVPDGNTAYVVMKQLGTIEGQNLESVDVTPAVREGESWSIGVPKEFETLIAMWDNAARDTARKPPVGCRDVAACVKAIQASVTRNWIRLVNRPSLKVKLQVTLDENAVVSNVSVAETSGDTEFDDSALRAVRRAGAFPELRGLDRETFEKTFRSFQFHFAPGQQGDTAAGR